MIAYWYRNTVQSRETVHQEIEVVFDHDGTQSEPDADDGGGAPITLSIVSLPEREVYLHIVTFEHQPAINNNSSVPPNALNLTSSSNSQSEATHISRAPFLQYRVIASLRHHQHRCDTFISR